MAAVFKELLAERRVYDYAAFRAEYRRAAMELNPSKEPMVPARSTFHRWCNGGLAKLPPTYHCEVLEHMFPGWKARDLFGRSDRRNRQPTGVGLIEAAPTMSIQELDGLWATAYQFEGRRHVDLTVIAVSDVHFTARNWPPAPRLEGGLLGHRNEISGSIVGRHLIGVWRNSSDRYYCGAVHLAAHPDMSILDGHYTSIVTDTAVTAGQWRWVKVDSQSAGAADLNHVRLNDPATVHDLLFSRGPYSGPIRLGDLVEEGA
ncbi:hypothetical protein [Mycobacterium intracellulare]|uniref:hypothetical protein n=1 Tax=Mycobacterium intracellulare TaxID=1767 RepID=UPI001EEEDE33|nr:hypothetical protein [Mycobacterium intracellulare]MEE3755311.1 hypothetical protein [Mycobacterium intracellulare]